MVIYVIYVYFAVILEILIEEKSLSLTWASGLGPGVISPSRGPVFIVQAAPWPWPHSTFSSPSHCWSVPSAWILDRQPLPYHRMSPGRLGDSNSKMTNWRKREGLVSLRGKRGGSNCDDGPTPETLLCGRGCGNPAKEWGRKRQRKGQGQGVGWVKKERLKILAVIYWTWTGCLAVRST